MKLPRPDYMDAFSWFDALRSTISNVFVPIMQQESDWRMIASFVRNYSGFKGKAPMPEDFPDWRSWAQAFYSNLGG